MGLQISNPLLESIQAGSKVKEEEEKNAFTSGAEYATPSSFSANPRTAVQANLHPPPVPYTPSPPVAPQPPSGASVAPAGAELGTPNTVQSFRDQLARSQAIAAFTDNPAWQSFNRATDVFQGGQNVASGLIQQQQAAQNQFTQNAFQGVLPQMQQTVDQQRAAALHTPQFPLGGPGGASVETPLTLSDLLEMDQRFRTDDVQRSLTRSFPMPNETGTGGTASTPFGGSLPNLGQTLGQQGPTSGFDFARDIGSGAAFVGGGLADTFDAASETVFDLANLLPPINQATLGADMAFNDLTGGGDDVFADAGRRATGGGLFQNVAEAKGDPINAFMRQGEDFSSRPLIEQIGVGAVADPLNAVPGIGFADDIADIARLGGAIGQRIGRGAASTGRGAIEAGARQTLTPPTATGRLGTGAIDPSTGRPFDFAPVIGAADELPSQVGPASPFPAPPALTRPDLPLGRLTEPEPPTPIRTPATPEAAKVQEIMDIEPLPPSRVLRRDELRGQQADQFASRRAAAAEAKELGLTGKEAAIYRQAAMRVEDPIGKANRVRRLQEEFTPEEVGRLYDGVLEAEDAGRITNAEATQATEALRKMFDEGIIPFQSQSDALGKAIGLDIISREGTIAKLSPADQALARQAPKGEIKIRQLEIRAEKQGDLAADLRSRAAARPSNKRLAEAAELAQKRALTLQNAADEAELARTTRLLEQVETKAGNARVAAAQKAVNRESAAAAKRDLGIPNDEMILTEAKRLLGENYPEASALNRAALQAIETWLEGTRRILDVAGPPSENFLTGLRGTITGDYDSFSTNLIYQRDIIASVLEKSGVARDVARKTSRALVEAEIARRFDGAVLPPRVKKALDRGIAAPEAPASVTRALDESRSGFGTVTSAAGTVSQDLKNVMFGPADIGVFGQQLLKAITVATPQAFVGFTNRMAAALGHPLVNVLPGNVPRRIAYELDGLGVGARTGIVDISDTRPSPLGRIPGVGKPIDAAINAITDLQFGTILGTWRELAHEGNLVLARAVGADITDPKVRRNAANAANAYTSFARQATRGKRRDLEKGSLLSASMTRAQWQWLGQAARILAPTAKVGREERLLAAVSVATFAGSVAVLGKVINDRYGIGEFQANPGEPGFGNITFPGNRVVPLLPQQQALKVIARSFTLLQEEDPEQLGRVWANYIMGRASPLAASGLKLTGWGYDPTQGWQYGDWGQGMSQTERLVNAAPVPPVFAAMVNESPDILDLGLEVLGTGVYPESAFPQQQRAFKEWVDELSPAERARLERDLQTNTDGEVTLENARFVDLPKGWQQQFQEAKPDAYDAALAEDIEKAGRGDEDAQRRVRARAIQQEEIIQPLADLEDQFDNGRGMLPEKALDRRREIFAEAMPKLAETWRDLPDREASTLLQEYQDVIQANDLEDGINWDAVEAWVADLPAAKQKLIEEHTGIGYTELDQEIRDAMTTIADTKTQVPLPSGRTVEASYFELSDVLFEDFKTAKGFPADLTRAQWEEDVYQAVRQQNQQQYPQYNEEQITNISRVDAATYIREFTSVLTQYRQDFRATNVPIPGQEGTVSDVLRYWGIGGTGREETAESLR